MSEQDGPDKPESWKQEPRATPERMYIEEYLRGKGQTLQSLQALPEEEARQLLVEASVYASGRLAEVETRARFVHDIHDSGSSLE
jgi:hypothetical protein